MDPMSSNLPPAGWHPDPDNPTGAMRWWDGNQWTSNVHPVNPAPNGSYGNGATGPGGPAWGGSPSWTGSGGPVPANATFARRNQASLTAMGVGLLYILADVSAHLFLIGILPILMAVRAVQRREQLAPVAVAVAVLVIIISIIVR
jgi:hypothetical protein